MSAFFKQKNEIVRHLSVSGVILLIVVIFQLIDRSFAIFPFLKFVLGLLVGTFILDADHFIYWFFLFPDLDESREAKRLWRERKWRQIWSLLEKTHKTHSSLVFHHVIFQFVLLMLSFFVLTSTTTFFGKGLVLAMSAHLCLDEWFDWKANPSHLKQWLFARTNLTADYFPDSWLQYYLYFYLLALGGLIGVFVS